jgi:hypothetical protein
LIYNNAVVSSNLTFNLTSYTLAFDSTGYTDTASGSLKVSYNINGTTPVNSSAVSVEVDNTAPTVSVAVEFEILAYGEEQETILTYTDSVDTSLTISQWVDRMEEGNTSAQSSRVASYDAENFMLPDMDEGYTAYGQAVDNCGKTTLAANTFNVQDEDKKVSIGEKVTEEKAESAKKKSSMLVIVLIIAVVAAVVIILLASNAKSSKRKRR